MLGITYILTDVNIINGQQWTNVKRLHDKLFFTDDHIATIALIEKLSEYLNCIMYLKTLLTEGLSDRIDVLGYLYYRCV